jgi:hypothetical protein
MFVTVLIFFLTAVAILVLVINEIYEPERAPQSQQRTPVPAIIR